MKRRAGAAGVRTVTATEFKAKCLAILEEVGQGGEVAVIRHGKARAIVGSVGKAKKPPMADLSHLYEFIGDIEAPLDLEWKAMK